MQAQTAKINGVIFSKDRAMQLEATLSSFFFHCLDSKLVSLHVLYIGSSELFTNQYCQLEHAFPAVNFVQQRNFKKDVMQILEIPQSLWKDHLIRLAAVNPKKYILFLVDDNIFIRDFRISDACITLEKEQDAIGFALQLGINIHYCYPLELHLKFPEYIHVLGCVIKYRWVDAGNGLNYPLEVSSSIYRWKDLIKLIASLEFSNPNTLESQLAQQTRTYRHSHPYLLCYKQSVTFCNPINKVQNTYDNKSGEKQEYHTDLLAHRFNEGYLIDIEAYQDLVPGACHQEEKLFFKKRKYLFSQIGDDETKTSQCKERFKDD